MGALNARLRGWDSSLGYWKVEEGRVSSGYRKTFWGHVEAGRLGKRLRSGTRQEWMS